MSNAFLKRRHPIGLYVIAGAIGLVMLMIVGLVVQVAVAPEQRRESSGMPAAVPLPGSVTGVDASGRPAPGPQGPLQLVQGKKLTRDVYVGYPHSTVGAISAAVQYWSQIGSTLEPARAAEIAPVIADRSWKTAAKDLANGPVSARKRLGLPVTGRVPEGASVLLTAMQYQLRHVRRDSVTVLLLAYYTTTLPGQGTQNRLGVFPVELRWTAGDWKVPEPDDSIDYSNLEAEPGSEEASALGWQPLTQ